MGTLTGFSAAYKINVGSDMMRSEHFFLSILSMYVYVHKCTKCVDKTPNKKTASNVTKW
jgi:hypothetical protein